MLKDRFTTRIAGLLFVVFPCIMGGSTLVLTSPALRSSRLLASVFILILPLWAIGAYLLMRGQKMPPDDDEVG